MIRQIVGKDNQRQIIMGEVVSCYGAAFDSFTDQIGQQFVGFTNDVRRTSQLNYPDAVKYISTNESSASNTVVFSLGESAPATNILGEVGEYYLEHYYVFDSVSVVRKYTELGALVASYDITASLNSVDYTDVDMTVDSNGNFYFTTDNNDANPNIYKFDNTLNLLLSVRIPYIDLVAGIAYDKIRDEILVMSITSINHGYIWLTTNLEKTTNMEGFFTNRTGGMATDRVIIVKGLIYACIRNFATGFVYSQTGVFMGEIINIGNGSDFKSLFYREDLDQLFGVKATSSSSFLVSYFRDEIITGFVNAVLGVPQYQAPQLFIKVGQVII
jgi:hypothetical protein